jgi:hypothetical protein
MEMFKIKLYLFSILGILGSLREGFDETGRVSEAIGPIIGG